MDFLNKEYDEFHNLTTWETLPIDLGSGVSFQWRKISKGQAKQYICGIDVSQEVASAACINSDHVLFLIDYVRTELNLNLLKWQSGGEFVRSTACINEDFMRKLSEATRIKLSLSPYLTVECDVLSQYARAGLYFLSNCKEYETEATAFAKRLCRSAQSRSTFSFIGSILNLIFGKN